MAASTLVETFKVLRDSEEWLNALEIAFQSDKGERACREAARELLDVGVVQVRLIDKRHYFLMSPLTTKLAKKPLIVDIIETIRIKDKPNANSNNSNHPSKSQKIP